MLWSRVCVLCMHAKNTAVSDFRVSCPYLKCESLPVMRIINRPEQFATPASIPSHTSMVEYLFPASTIHYYIICQHNSKQFARLCQSAQLTCASMLNMHFASMSDDTYWHTPYFQHVLANTIYVSSACTI